jgi:hypothetical protein
MALTLERLKYVLTYNPDTGIFIWNHTSKGHIKGSIAGCLGKRGYTQISIDRHQYRAGRLAWLYMTGTLPDLYVDHIDNNPNNDRWDNLRLVNASKNMMNSTIHKDGTSTNIKGIYIDKHKSIHAQVVKDGVRYRKIFSDLAQAVTWLRAIRETLHGEFANHG